MVQNFDQCFSDANDVKYHISNERRVTHNIKNAIPLPRNSKAAGCDHVAMEIAPRAVRKSELFILVRYFWRKGFKEDRRK